MSDSWLEMKVLQFLLLAKPTTHYFALVAFYEHLDEHIIIIDRWEGLHRIHSEMNIFKV